MLPGGHNFIRRDNIGDTWNDGWFAGAGFDYVVHKGALVDVLVGAEYQHFDVKQKPAFCFFANCTPPIHQDFLHGARGDIVRAHLTIKTQGWRLLREEPTAMPAR